MRPSVLTVCFGLEASVNLRSQRLLGSWSCGFPESTGFPVGICQKSAASQCVWEELLLEAHCLIWVPRDAAEGPGSWGVKLSGGAPPRNGLWPTVWRQVDRRPDGPQGPEPLPGQEARTAAELDEELPFTQPVGLDHLAERFVRWGPPRRESRDMSDFGACFMALTIPLYRAGGGDTEWGWQPGQPSQSPW